MFLCNFIKHHEEQTEKEIWKFPGGGNDCGYDLRKQVVLRRRGRSVPDLYLSSLSCCLSGRLTSDYRKRVSEIRRESPRRVDEKHKMKNNTQAEGENEITRGWIDEQRDTFALFWFLLQSELARFGTMKHAVCQRSRETLDPFLSLWVSTGSFLCLWPFRQELNGSTEAEDVWRRAGQLSPNTTQMYFTETSLKNIWQAKINQLWGDTWLEYGIFRQ